MKYQCDINVVWIDLVAHEKLWNWTRLAKGEVSMLGLVEDTPAGPVITDLFLVRQQCSSASTDMDQADVSKLLFDLAASGLEGQLRAWLHSHGSMDCFWSKQDDSCIEGLAADPYCVSLVVNHRGDTRARVDVFRPVRFTIDDVPVKLRVPDLGLEEQCRAEFLAKVVEAPLFAFSGDPRVSHALRGSQGIGQSDLFATGCHGSFAMLDIAEMEEAVHRGEMTVDEYMAAIGDGFVDPFEFGGDPGEVADARHP